MLEFVIWLLGWDFLCTATHAVMRHQSLDRAKTEASMPLQALFEIVVWVYVGWLVYPK